MCIDNRYSSLAFELFKLLKRIGRWVNKLLNYFFLVLKDHSKTYNSHLFEMF